VRVGPWYKQREVDPQMMKRVVTMANHEKELRKPSEISEHIPESSVILKQLCQEKGRSNS